ncbi:hypothetical protein BDV96DRAFT_610159 [Lophiotrema nucula]|uniref:Zn(2)-C6 fungal-type domain-containing protein n=1 Tax=Lophiotrema nucula TaxID=690887 RepID=A0A6A5ZP87_9PLEO|nr:hypothetical protein BDV96DRAFT_610159 [Lophiotrema nucula]
MQCDQRRPACGQCEEKGLICGGYDRDRIFVNEYKPPSRESDNSARLVVWRSEGPERTLSKTPSKTPSSTPDSIPLPQSLISTAYTEGTLGTFYYVYCPALRKISTNHFADNLQALYGHDEALRVATLALSSASLGRATNDRVLIEQGRDLYGRALYELARAIKNPVRAKNDALLAVPRVMGMFEILFGSDIGMGAQAKSWGSHAKGELAITQGRGPEMHISGNGHQLFVDGRQNPIIAGIWQRKATPMNDIEWKTIPWRYLPKTPKDTLLDILAEVPAILEKSDILKDPESDLTPAAKNTLREAIVTRCFDLDTTIKYWEAVNTTAIYHPSSETPTPIEFSTMTEAHLTLLYWTICIEVYECLELALGYPSSSASETARFYAYRITRALRHFFKPEWGLFGATTASFPAGVAMLHLRTYPREGDEGYMMLVGKAWNDPNLPKAVKTFLNSMRASHAKKG